MATTDFCGSIALAQIDQQVLSAELTSELPEIVWTGFKMHRNVYGYWPGAALREAAITLDRRSNGRD